MKKILMLLVLVFTFSGKAISGNEGNNSSTETTEAVAASYSLKGTVYDPNDDETLSGACIIVDGRKYYSDLSGSFYITQLKKGKHLITIDFISYQSRKLEVDLDKNEEIRIEIKQL